MMRQKRGEMQMILIINDHGDGGAKDDGDGGDIDDNDIDRGGDDDDNDKGGTSGLNAAMRVLRMSLSKIKQTKGFTAELST